MTIREAIEAFRMYVEDVTGRPTSGDGAFPPKLLYYVLTISKNSVLHDDVRRIRVSSATDDILIMDIPCVELEPADIVSECPCALPSGCIWLKSKHFIPSPVDGKLFDVKTIDGSIGFNYVAWNVFEDRVVNSRYIAARRGNYYTLRNVEGRYRLYVYSVGEVAGAGALSKVAIRGIFTDILEVLEFPMCSDDDVYICDVLDKPFVVPYKDMNTIYERALQLLINTMRVSMGVDILNNKNNDSKARISSSEGSSVQERNG